MRRYKLGKLISVGTAMCASLVVLLVWSAPSNALIHRGHTFGGSFGTSFGQGDKLSGPSGVAVNELTGDVYVLDSANNRVVRFGPAPEHGFLEAWGYGVATGAAAYQQCAAPAKCQVGIPGFGNAQFESPVAIAIDNAVGSPSRGDVYVVANRSAKKTVIDKFSPTGQLLGTLVSSKEEKEEVVGMIVGVAVDKSGVVWVEREAEENEFLIARFSREAAKKPGGPIAQIGEPSALEVGNPTLPQPARPGFAIDSQHNIYVTYEPLGKDAEEIEEEEEEIAEREKVRKKNKEELKNEQPERPCTVHTCQVAKLAIKEDSGGELEAKLLISEEAGDGTNTTGIAVNPQSADDAFFDNGTSVGAFTAAGSPIERFGSGQLQGGSGLGVYAKTGEVLVADADAGDIDTYVLLPPGSPSVLAGSVTSAGITSTSATLKATIDANGAETRYRFLYGVSSCAADPSACSEVPAAPGGDLGQGFGDQLASAQVGSLTPGTTYFLLVIAENQFADGAGAVVSEERTFTTLPSELGAALPDGRAWELVSPPNKNGGAVEPIFGTGGGVIQASSDGRGIAYMLSAPAGDSEPEGNREPERSQTVASRAQPGVWSSTDIVPPNEVQGIRNGAPRIYQAFSTDLQDAVLNPSTAEALSPKAAEGEQTIYLRHSALCGTPEGCFEPLVTRENATSGTPYNKAAAFRAATPDMRHVILESQRALKAGENPAAIQPRLYEWTAGQPELELLSVLPGGEQARGGTYLGSIQLSANPVRGMLDTAISADGSRVVWQMVAEKAGQIELHMFMREVPQKQTLLVDDPNTGVPAPREKEPRPAFETASADGSKVFFTDSRRLTADSTAPELGGQASPRDLYVFEADKPAGERLTDLSVPLAKGEAGAIQGRVLGTSDDGSFVYFVGNGALTQASLPGGCFNEDSPPSKRCNVYVAHFADGHWEAPRLIARVSAQDSPDWGGPVPAEPSLKDQTARTSPNGQYLAFMSNQSLTGYDNRDQNSGVPDEEVFLYHYADDPESDSLVCASCNPSGAQPVGVHDVEESGEGLGLVIDRALTWTDETAAGDATGRFAGGVNRWLAGSVPGWTAIGNYESHHQSSYLSDSGRLFFNSSDTLVPRDRNNGKADVYQYEPKGVGSCTQENAAGGCVALISSGESARESAFMDASANGDDVFFITVAKLSALDYDTAYDLYDARVCNAAGAEPCEPPPPPPSPPPCNSEACKPPPTPVPGWAAPASTNTSPSSNLVGQGVLGTKTQAKPPTRAQLLAAAMKKCHKLKRRRRRVACEQQARKKYGVKRRPGSASRVGR